MNPYAYKRKRINLSLEKSGQQISLIKLIKEVFSSNISSPIAFAAMAVGVVSVLTLSLAVEAGVDSLAMSPEVKKVSVSQQANKVASFAQKAQVLGVSEYPKTLLTSSWNSTIKIYAQPLEYNAGTGKWVYEITWSRKKNTVGSLYVAGMAVADSANQTGFVKVELASGSRVKLEFYSQANKKGTLLVRKYFNIKDKPAGDIGLCTADAKLCWDSKYVSRTGPKCEFTPCAPCPSTTSRMCSNGSTGTLNPDTCQLVCQGPQDTGSNLNFRYLKVNTVNSWSWVSWREIEVYDSYGNKITPTDVTAKNTWKNEYYGDGKDHSPKLAIDGDVNTAWNAGETAPNCNWNSLFDRAGCGRGGQSSWIQIDLGSVKAVSKIKLLPESSPVSNYATHQLLISSDGASYSKAEEYIDYIKSNVWLEHPGRVYSASPAVNLTVEGSKEVVAYKSQYIKFAWKAEDADFATVQVTEVEDPTLSKVGRDEDYLCRQAPYKLSQPINPFALTYDNRYGGQPDMVTLSGEKMLLVGGCYVGKKITITYTAKQRNGGKTSSDTIIMKVQGSGTSQVNTSVSGIVEINKGQTKTLDGKGTVNFGVESPMGKWPSKLEFLNLPSGLTAAVSSVSMDTNHDMDYSDEYFFKFTVTLAASFSLQTGEYPTLMVGTIPGSGKIYQGILIKVK